MEKYVPVSCQLHSELELVIMHENMLQIKLLNSQEMPESIIVKPYNIFIKDKEEFLQAKNSSGESITIRLDRIISFQIKANV